MAHPGQTGRGILGSTPAVSILEGRVGVSPSPFASLYESDPGGPAAPPPPPPTLIPAVPSPRAWMAGEVTPFGPDPTIPHRPPSDEIYGDKPRSRADLWFDELTPHDQEMITEKLREVQAKVPAGQAIPGDVFLEIMADLMADQQLTIWEKPNTGAMILEYLNQFAGTPGTGGVISNRVTDKGPDGQYLVPMENLTPEEYAQRAALIVQEIAEQTGESRKTLADEKLRGEWTTGLQGPIIGIDVNGKAFDASGNIGVYTIPESDWGLWNVPTNQPTPTPSGGDTPDTIAGLLTKQTFDPEGIPGTTIIGERTIGGQVVHIVQQADGSTGYYDRAPIREMVAQYDPKTGLQTGVKSTIVAYGPVTWFPLTNAPPEFEGERDWVNQLVQTGVVPPMLQRLGVGPEGLPPGSLPAFQPNRPFLQRIANNPALQNQLTDFYARQLGIPREAAAREITRIAGTLSPLSAPVTAPAYAPAVQGSTKN